MKTQDGRRLVPTKTPPRDPASEERENDEFWLEMIERNERGDRLTIELTPQEAFRLGFLLRLALRDSDIHGLWKVTEQAAGLRQRINQWLAETPAGARQVAEEQEWERKYEPSFAGRV